MVSDRVEHLHSEVLENREVLEQGGVHLVLELPLEGLRELAQHFREVGPVLGNVVLDQRGHSDSVKVVREPVLLPQFPQVFDSYGEVRSLVDRVRNVRCDGADHEVKADHSDDHPEDHDDSFQGGSIGKLM